MTDDCPLIKDKGADSILRCHFTSMGNPIVETRRSYDWIISTMGFPILVRWHLYIESGFPCHVVPWIIDIGCGVLWRWVVVLSAAHHKAYVHGLVFVAFHCDLPRLIDSLLYLHWRWDVSDLLLHVWHRATTRTNVDLTHRNTLKRNCSRNSYIFVERNAFVDVTCSIASSLFWF